jgi:hypothetical protein
MPEIFKAHKELQAYKAHKEILVRKVRMVLRGNKVLSDHRGLSGFKVLRV